MQLTHQTQPPEDETPSAPPAPEPHTRPEPRDLDTLAEAQNLAWEILSRLPVNLLR